jgi:hypothetical protein
MPAPTVACSAMACGLPLSQPALCSISPPRASQYAAYCLLDFSPEKIKTIAEITPTVTKSIPPPHKTPFIDTNENEK